MNTNKENKEKGEIRRDDSNKSSCGIINEAGKMSAQELFAKVMLDSTVVDSLQPPLEVEFSSTDVNRFRPHSVHFWGYSIATTIGGSFYGWNHGLQQGYGSFVIGLVLSGLSFLILSCSLAEIISSTGFSGGAYGMTRVVSGFYVGFITAFLEVAEYITYISMSVLYMGNFVKDQWDLNEMWVPVIWIPFYVISIALLMERKKVCWNVILLFALFSLIVAVVYIFGYFSNFNILRGASLRENKGNAADIGNWFYGGIVSFIRYFPYSSWFFAGVETTSLMPDLLRNPKREFPRAIISSTVTLFVVAIAISFVSVSMLNCLQEVQHLTFFMDYRFGKIGIPSNTARWLIFPGQFSMALGFILPAANLLNSMTKSHLLPQWKQTVSGNSCDYAIVFACLCSYFLCLVAFYVPSVNMTNIPILLGYLTYIIDMVSYWVYKTNFGSLKREYVSPFGIFGAIFASLVFCIGAISIVFFQEEKSTAIYVICYIGLLSLYYFFYAKKRQMFSNSETKSFFTLHLIKYNVHKKINIRKKKTASLRNGNIALSTLLSTVASVTASASERTNVLHRNSDSNRSSPANEKKVTSFFSDVDSTISAQSASSRQTLSSSINSDPSIASSMSSGFRRNSHKSSDGHKSLRSCRRIAPELCIPSTIQGHNNVYEDFESCLDNLHDQEINQTENRRKNSVMQSAFRSLSSVNISERSLHPQLSTDIGCGEVFSIGSRNMDMRSVQFYEVEDLDSHGADSYSD